MKNKIEGWICVIILIVYAITGLILLTAGNVASFLMGLYLVGGGFLLFLISKILRILERLEEKLTS